VPDLVLKRKQILLTALMLYGLISSSMIEAMSPTVSQQSRLLNQVEYIT